MVATNEPCPRIGRKIGVRAEIFIGEGMRKGRGDPERLGGYQGTDDRQEDGNLNAHQPNKLLGDLWIHGVSLKAQG